MARPRRLADGSIRTTDWQQEEYERLMGKEARERQAKLAAGQCVCKRRTVKTRGVFRTLHERSCSKWKPYMEQIERDVAERGNRESAEAHVRSFE